MEDRNALDQLMQTARELCSSSKECGVDTRSALAGGAVGILLSSRHGRSLVGKALKYGAVAGLGALAWQARQEHSRTSGSHSRYSYTDDPSRSEAPTPSAPDKAPDAGTSPPLTE